ncbi:YjbH domain-containing protein [Robbsia sp. KACC 23696]|uniref:YjbH domain-containing protein n=1 Tax=Robbsia sp. KACC 23696 TaxID=3149231 RepID=UPI00325B2F81
MRIKSVKKQPRLALLMTGLLASVFAPMARADQIATIATPIRLGDWLVSAEAKSALAGSTDADMPPFLAGVVWQSHREIAQQEIARQKLIHDIQSSITGDPSQFWQASRVAALIDGFPATGRVPLKNADPRWLQGNPSSDPLLEPGDVVRLPDRPKTVTVVRTTGSLCVIPYQVNAEARHYVGLCDTHETAPRAWIGQPDGSVANADIARWNNEAQVLPAPGAWIWAPNEDEHWSDALSERIASFFASQGVSDDNPRFRPTVPTPVPSPSDVSRSYEVRPTSSDWGDVGVLQTPSARMSPVGSASFSASTVNPYIRLNVMFQPLEWLEFGFRYTEITNVRYNPGIDFGGTQGYKDKSVDVKIRLLKETKFRPAVAVGIRDLGGTGIFSGEYLVASKRYGAFDWSLGLGWGYLGSRGMFENPLTPLSAKFNTRGSSSGAGSVGTSYFRGPTSLFGGVQYQTPWDPLILKLEFDGNNYQSEPFGNKFKDRSPFNVGFVYKAGRNLHLSVAFERGSRLMFGLAIHGNLSQASFPKFGDLTARSSRISQSQSDGSPILASENAPSSDNSNFDSVSPEAKKMVVQPLSQQSVGEFKQVRWKTLSDDLTTELGWHVADVRSDGDTLIVSIDDPNAFYLHAPIEKATAILNRDAPSDIKTFRLEMRQSGMPIADFAVDRNSWVAAKTRLLPPSDRKDVSSSVPLSRGHDGEIPLVYNNPPKWFTGSIGPGYQQSFGGPDGFLFAISAAANGQARLTQTSWITGTVNLNLIDNYSRYKSDSYSALPKVRTDVRQYVTSSRLTLPNLQVTKVGRVGASNFYSVYGGLLESMFAGVGAEWLYRPYGSRLAIGVDGNEVRQRGFRQDFAMLPYRTFTGHVTAYWDTGWNGVQANVSFGRYLAKDTGISVDISRAFQNGVRIGIYATKTNISAAEFGEGSFDKGIYMSFPFDMILTRSSDSIGRATWAPVLRDGGAKLARHYSLYEMTNLSDLKSIWYAPPTANRQPPTANRQPPTADR